MSLQQQAPRFDLAAARLAPDCTGSTLVPASKQCARPGPTCSQPTGGGRYVLEVANAGRDRVMLEAQKAGWRLGEVGNGTPGVG